jgi:putative copper export protein
VAPDLGLAFATRWAGLVGLAALLGGLVVSLAVIPTDRAALQRRLIAWSYASVALLLVAGAGEVLERTRTMAGASPAAALGVVPVVLARTHFGTVWIVRTGALVALLALIGRSSRALRIAAYGVALGVALSTTLVGHAADHGDLSVPVLIDWVHVSAAVTWTGGLFCLTTLVLPEAAGWPREDLALVLRRFSALAGWCLALVVATGFGNACLQLGSLHALATTAYGRILVAKVMLVAAMACLGAANRFAVLPGIVGSTVARPPTARLARYVAWEAALALVVFACTALLTQATPPRHVSDRMVAPPTMEQPPHPC